MASEKITRKRLTMVDSQLTKRGISDKNVLNAIKTVPRDEFVSLPFRNMAYFDGPLPIGQGQTISQPYIIGYMTEALEVKPHHTVLEIGTGCGYQTAVLSLLAKKIISLEIHNSLAVNAEKRLKRLGYKNVEIHHSDGKKGWGKNSPYHRILVTACPQKVPSALINQMANDGIMVIPVGEEKESQILMVITKNKDGKVKIKPTLPVRFVPML
jgi:protein-L-isoaspartate(D-aspartate) O-methyltransferase